MSEITGALERIRGGDEQALAELLAHAGPVVHARIASDIGPQWRGTIEADDVLQVTYLEAFLHIDRVQAEDEAAFVAWLSRIAKNNLRDAIRSLGAAKRPDPRNRQRTKAPTDASYVGLVATLSAAGGTPSVQVAAGEARSFLKAALQALPEDYRAVIRMYDLESQSIEEVCETLGRSAGAVYMLRARAHDALRERMGSASNFFSQGS
ncbi:MAG: sigma-70 family RNA polymerase sigma factor [Phycisphaerales bacterium]